MFLLQSLFSNLLGHSLIDHSFNLSINESRYLCVWIMAVVSHMTSQKENEVAGFVGFFTVAFLLFLAPVCGSNPVEPIS